MTPIMPDYLVHRTLHERSSELMKYHCTSVWYYDEKEKAIVICTNRPGLWIGLHGTDSKNLENEINEILTKRNKEQIHIKVIECDS